jgi:hypothetical protein
MFSDNDSLATSADLTSMTMDKTEPTLPRPGHDKKDDGTQPAAPWHHAPLTVRDALRGWATTPIQHSAREQDDAASNPTDHGA